MTPKGARRSSQLGGSDLNAVVAFLVPAPVFAVAVDAGDRRPLSPEEAAKQIKQSHINARIIKDWQAQALLTCTVPELSGAAAQLLVGAGVTPVEDLATSDLDALVDAVAMLAASDEGERALRGGAVPGRDQIKSWIDAALAVCEGSSAA